MSGSSYHPQHSQSSAASPFWPPAPVCVSYARFLERRAWRQKIAADFERAALVAVAESVRRAAARDAGVTREH